MGQSKPSPYSLLLDKVTVSWHNASQMGIQYLMISRDLPESSSAMDTFSF